MVWCYTYAISVMALFCPLCCFDNFGLAVCDLAAENKWSSLYHTRPQVHLKTLLYFWVIHHLKDSSWNSSSRPRKGREKRKNPRFVSSSTLAKYYFRSRATLEPSKSEIIRAIRPNEMVRHDHTPKHPKCNYLFVQFLRLKSILDLRNYFWVHPHIYLYIQSCWHRQVTFTSLENGFIGAMGSGLQITFIWEAIKVGRFCMLISASCTKTVLA